MRIRPRLAVRALIRSSPPSRHLDRGHEVYVHNCASCHGQRGEGDGPGAAGLHPAPANLAEHEYTLDRLSFALWNGIAGTAMPAWRDLPVQDLSAAASVVREFHATQQEPTLPDEHQRLGAQVYKVTARSAMAKAARGTDRRSARSHGADKLPRRAPQPRREPPRSAKRSGRDADGAVDRQD